MTEPWFDPNRYAWVFGAALGIVGGLLNGVFHLLNDFISREQGFLKMDLCIIPLCRFA